ncbi:LacI family DNA-binding transcriptional regulator [Candidatus Puniceispirillum marinum]|nr:LacI family DNA-binding transcriptional regulator [Candidatus Puniceispirillum marinum]
MIVFDQAIGNDQTMGQKPKHNRFEDIARHAGVGTATVDRVLNERGGVSVKTMKKVLYSARTLGTRRVLPEIDQRTLRIEAVLARKHSAYYDRLAKAFQMAASFANVPVTVYRTHIDDDAPDKLAAHVRDVASYRDGIIIYGNNHPNVAAQISALAHQVPVLTISTDILHSNRHSHVGINDIGAGQSAAKLCEAICRGGGQVLVIAPEKHAQSLQDRFGGFTEFFNVMGKRDQLVIIKREPILDHTLSKIRNIVRQNPNIRALYSTTNDDMLEMLFKSLQSDTQNFDFVKIVHDLDKETITHLRSGLIDIVIDSNPARQVLRAIEIISAHHGMATESISELVDFQIFTSDNIPESYF